MMRSRKTTPPASQAQAARPLAPTTGLSLNASLGGYTMPEKARRGGRDALGCISRVPCMQPPTEPAHRSPPPSPQDVRMRGFRDRAEVADVTALLEARLRSLTAEAVDLHEAAS